MSASEARSAVAGALWVGVAATGLAGAGPTWAQTAASAPATGSLPGGASSLSEQHGDWTVACGTAAAANGQPPRTVCAVSQRQTNGQGQTVVAIELHPAAKSGAEGVALLPFGLAVRDAVVLKVDGAPLGAPLTFSTCLPTGCLVPLGFDGAAATKLGSGKRVTLTTAQVGGGAPVELAVSPTGLTNALARAADLTKAR